MSQARKALALDRQRQRSRGLQANRAFVVESLLLLLFLSLGLALILRVFSVSDISARQAHAKNASLHLASNAAEIFAADPLSQPETTFFDASGAAVEQDSAEAAFQVDVDITPRDAEAGTLYDAAITVAPLNIPNAEPYTLETTRYVSDARLAALEAYAAMQNAGASASAGQSGQTSQDTQASQDVQADQNTQADQDAQADQNTQTDQDTQALLDAQVTQDGAEAGDAA